VKKPSLLLLLAFAACSGDSTGSTPSLAGQWIFRMRPLTVENLPVGCQVVSYVRLTGSGDSFSGRMRIPESSCVGVYDISASFDSTTTVTARVEGDSVLLTVHAGEYELRQTARILGDSLAGQLTGDGTGVMAARRYPDSVPLDRAAVQLSGAVTRTVELFGYGAWNGLRFASATKDEAVLLLPTSPSRPVLTVGTYAVANSVDAPLYGDYARFVGGKIEDVQFTSGTVTVTQADAQLVTGTFDVTGTILATGEQVRVQADFTSHRSGYPGLGQ